MTTLVTGGAGMIGSGVARYIAQQLRKRVVILDRVPSGTDPVSLVGSDPLVEYVQGTVTDLSLVLRLIKDCDVDTIVHTAAVLGSASSAMPLESLQVNVVGTAGVLEAARIMDIRRTIVFSSSAVMGDPEDLHTPRREEQIVLPAVGLYAIGKLTIEQLANTYRELYHVDVVAMRPRTVYGPGFQRPDRPLPLERVVTAAARGEDVVYEHGGDTEFDLTYVKDACKAVVDALMAPGKLPSHVYNLSYGANVRMGEVFNVLRQLLPRQEISVGPGPWDGTLARGRQRDLSYRMSARPPQDITRARADFGYRPEWPVSRAIPDYVRWLQTGEYGSW